MNPAEFRVEATRGTLVESIHRVSVAVVDADGRLRAAAGNPDLVTWWRSGAKPFQALPLLQDGAAERFGLNEEEIAIACASHSSEPRHLELIERFMAKVGVTEPQLACGIHPPLSPLIARMVARGSIALTPRWSNCSGKHTGMLALAKHHGWPLEGYHSAGHPVQERIAAEISRWSGVARSDLQLAVDGCTAACFGLPLRGMALAYARLVGSVETAPSRITTAMMRHPFLIAGTGRLCTDVMLAWPDRVVAKVGADGVYSAALPARGLGIALKVEDGDMRSSAIALVEVFRQLGQPTEALARHARQPIQNTRGVVTGEFRPAGVLRLFDD
jgi:L-asparaginase II